MDSDDPFANSGGGRTVLRPTPGRRGGGTSQQDRSPFTSTTNDPPNLARRESPQKLLSQLGGSGLNPIVDAATALLMLATQLRYAVTHHDVTDLRDQVVAMVKEFERRLQAKHCSAETIVTARYVLCTFVDENIASTPWGHGVWTAESLLALFHKETWGGEKFYQILDKLARNAAEHRELLELMYLCLALGFQGKYGVDAQGHRRLAELQDNLYRALANLSHEHERDLSPHWQGVIDKRNALVRYVPLWVIAVVLAVLLFGMYGSFSYLLRERVEPVIEKMDKVADLQESVEVNAVAIALPASIRRKS
ncbi:MAG: type IVB secretion system protein IcmH/DotU [Pseudomonadales bacterium]